MSTSKISALYGLKWNPFSPDIPVEGLRRTEAIEHFVRRVETLAKSGGFAGVFGDPGAGKSALLRIVSERLQSLRDVKVAQIERPQASLPDFYRELGDIFGVALRPHNRWGGTKLLREAWVAHLDASLFRPVLIVDEAQEMVTTVFRELRLLSSADFDSKRLLTVVLAGDRRLTDRFRSDELLPIGSRIRVRLSLEAASPIELAEHLRHVMEQAGNARLMSPELVLTLSEHAAGNPRILMQMADDILAIGTAKEAKQLDEKLYFEAFALPETTKLSLKKDGRKR